jgi:hypothetical protein
MKSDHTPDAWAHLSQFVAADVCVRWLDFIEARYAAVDRSDPNNRDFSLRSSSMRLFSIPGIDLESVSELPAICERMLDAPVFCDVDQCWVRRQYSPGNYPPLHAPHSWHQDGALHFDFQACAGRKPPPDAMLDMITCWIPLTPCGIDAPGLELIATGTEGLLIPAQLTDRCIRERFALEDFRRPAMQPGDILLFRGGVLHRTHVTPEMTRDRTSIELRFFAADRHGKSKRLKD